MARPRLARNLARLHTEERAIISTMDTHSDAVALKCYGIALGLSSEGLHILTDELVPTGEMLDIAISLQGQGPAHNLKGVARSVSACDYQPGFIVGIEILTDNQAAQLWRRQFH